MLSTAYDISDEGLRLLANVEQHYVSWIEAARVLLPGRLAWKTVDGREYLYRLVNGKGHGRSLGPRSVETEALHVAAQAARQTVETLGRYCVRRARSIARSVYRVFPRQRRNC